METTLITMPKAEARRKLRAVRTAIHRKADAEYLQLEQAYKELANDRPLINLVEAFSLAPVDDRGRPKMAIASAIFDQVEFSFNTWSRIATFDCHFGWGRRGRRPLRAITHVSMPNLTAPEGSIPKGYAIVPIVPPEVKRHHDLSKCHVLWEVEQWANQAIRSTPDRDPLLLRFVGGDLWAVLGEWELTEVERAVMMGRRQQ